MKLFLSSYQIGTAPDALLGLLGARRQAVVVANAADHFADARRAAWVERCRGELERVGVPSRELDLRTHFGRPDLRGALSDVGLIWVTGGNTFLLRKAMRASGLDVLLPELLAGGELVYGGFSAGACVASPSLAGIALADHPEREAAGYPSDVPWDGLGLIGFYVVPHYRSDHPESASMEAVVAYYEEHGLPHVDLRDGQAVVVSGPSVEVVGAPV